MDSIQNGDFRNNTVAAAMREMELNRCVSRKFKPTKITSNPDKKPSENILSLEFEPLRITNEWLTSLACERIAGGFVWLLAGLVQL
ncbi:hypothetical protein MFFC18_50680 [Mariniblastus fucicola]|uniref:Uncharacterized protein n=1 Tax=Mariniblastus fucicola TaxID=980251 RepID=A0A5B9PFR1_9BACT|nr:hypothetical protein MFFC18_50680 [Mariniblastus fucicola]